MIERIGPVTDVSAIGHLPEANVYRSDRIPEGQTGGLRTHAARLDLLETVGATVHSGTWLNEATHRYPAVVLGAKAAQRLGIRAPHPDAQILVGGVLFTVVGILDPAPLAPELDYAALVGWPAAETYLDFDGHPTTVYARSVESYVEAVRAVLGPTANPEAPHEVTVSRPSDALAAQRAAGSAFTGLLLGLGAVALLVGGVGVGAVLTAAFAAYQGWPATVPSWVAAGGVSATMLIGALAGLYPAVRAARVSPTEALATG